MVFSTIDIGDKHAGPSGLGDLEVTEYYYNYNARVRRGRGPLEREDGASVHLATTEARFMTLITVPFTLLLYLSHLLTLFNHLEGC